MYNKILILAPHTDDAELGCGGTIAKFIEEGKNILWVVFSTAEESLPTGMPRDTLKKEFIEVTKKLGLNKNNYLIEDFKVRRLNEKRQEVLELLVEVRNTYQPDLVIGPSQNDYHQDHLVLSNEMIRAFKSRASIISYELPWNHVTFNTQLFVELNDNQLEKKNELLKCYKSQLIKNRNYFSQEFINGLARIRGVQVETKYAEAFEVIRWII
jgi:LmbE family N-acetylglucosaminyl deacetylase